MDIGQSFAYITEDEKWVQKLGVGALIGIIPIANFAAFGYQVQIARNVWRGEERPLPTWDDFSKFFVDGLRIIAAMFVYMLPLFLVYGLIMGGIFTYAFTVDPAVMNSSSGSTDPFFGTMMIVMSLSMLCIMPYILLIWILYPMFFMQIARRGSVKACFDIREMWTLVRAQPVNYLIVIAITFGLYMVISMVLTPVYIVAMFIPCIGFIFTMMLSGMITILVGAVSGHLEGQFILLGDDLTALRGIEKEPI